MKSRCNVNYVYKLNELSESTAVHFGALLVCGFLWKLIYFPFFFVPLLILIHFSSYFIIIAFCKRGSLKKVSYVNKHSVSMDLKQN